MYVTLRLGESGEERKISSVSWELCLSPSYDEMGKKPKASSEEDYVVIFIFLFYFLFLFWGLRWCWMEVKCVKANRYKLDFCTFKSPLSGPFQLSERTKKSPPGIPKMQILYAIPPHLLACTGRSFLLSIFSISCILLTMLQRWAIIFSIKA